MTDPLLTLVADSMVAEIRRQTDEPWPVELEAGMWFADDTLDIAKLALAALSVIREQEGTLVLNMRLALDTAIKHKLETETHGGLTEFGEGGLATLRSLEREFDYLATHFRPLPAPPLERL